MHIHILGICGTFMAGVAALAKGAGHTVTGSDANVYPPMSTQLKRLGIDLVEGYDPAQLAPRPDIVVIGNALSRGNTAVEAVLDLGIPYTSGPAWLAEHVLAGRHVMAVAGTHGKTTTASMLAWILEHAGFEPGFLIGGVASNFEVTARVGGSEFFVVEADEYDSAFFDKRAKFVHYRPRTAVLNNLEYDHADIYADLDAILWQFHQLLRMVPAAGRIVANGADSNVRAALAQGCWTPVETFGLDEGLDWHGSFDDKTERRIRIANAAGEHAVALWKMTGAYNLENAIAAVAAARSAGVSVEQALDALAQFDGVKRRLERTATVADVAVYDDFAHHPTAIRRTIDGLRRRHPGRRIIVALEPRSNTMKMGVHNDTLAASLDGADIVHVYRPDDVDEAFDDLFEALGDRVALFSDYDLLVASLVELLDAGDQMVFMSNGGFGAVRQKLTLCLKDAS